MATTRVAAEAIGIEDLAGTLEPGKWADLIFVRGDPLADIRVLQDADRITTVIRAGKIVKGSSPLAVAAGR